MKTLSEYKNKIEKEEDIRKIGWDLEDISTDREFAENLVKSIDLNNLEKKIENEKNIDKIGVFLTQVAAIDKEAAKKLIPLVKDKITREEDVWKVSWCLGKIASFDRDISESFIPCFTEKLRKEKDLNKIGICTAAITHKSSSAGVGFVMNLDFKDLENKIELEGDVEVIGRCIGDLARISREFSKIINVNNLKSKIDNEEDIEKIGSFFESVYLGNKELAERILKLTDLEILGKKIDKEEDLNRIGRCIERVGSIDETTKKKITLGLSRYRLKKLNAGGWNL